MKVSVDKDLYKVILSHMAYSFFEIDWEFDRLTLKEKSLIRNQETLDRIRDAIKVESGATC